MRFINALISCSVIAITSSSVLAQSTAVQWTTASGGNGHWYERVNLPSEITWTSSNAAANALNGHLVTLTSATEQSWVYQTLVVGQSGCFTASWAIERAAWIGLFQDTTDPAYSEPNGGWKWVTNEPLSYNNWHPGEPNNGSSENVAGMYVLYQGQWNDEPNDASLYCYSAYIIEWSADCNNDGIVDYGQILSGELIDANGDGIPDCCESGTACDGNLIQNGGLEGGSYSACNGFNILSAGSTVIPGWTIGPNGIDWIWSLSSGPCCDWAPQGDRTIDLNGSPSQNGGAIRQTIQTQPGKHYKFSMRGLSNACCSEVGGQKIMRLTLGSSSSEHVFITLGGPSPECDSMNWTRVERTWVATATDSLIELKSLVPNSAGGIIVDDISVIEIDPCPGDISGNNSVDGVDLSVLLGVWGTDGSGGEFDADVTNDGIVNGADLTIILGGWGPCPN